jgi:hypothetical protein
MVNFGVHRAHLLHLSNIRRSLCLTHAPPLLFQVTALAPLPAGEQSSTTFDIYQQKSPQKKNDVPPLNFSPTRFCTGWGRPVDVKIARDGTLHFFLETKCCRPRRLTQLSQGQSSYQMIYSASSAPHFPSSPLSLPYDPPPSHFLTQIHTNSHPHVSFLSSDI